ncbi:hypothetical protein [Planomonospora sp. ID82291]|uniref:hypothetical protein n=1 Tax=Planomonospora sp. ID82291 TaxID=2738136 RepID=UPI0018C40639|nr:hypothetical protein [Planomonospora sp. ID82291]MBG0815949.1 hypothetical protein [Planomonospora sp. ID82291]
MHVPSSPDQPGRHGEPEILTGSGRGSRRGSGRGRDTALRGRRGLAVAVAAAAVLLAGGVAGYTFASSGDGSGSVSEPRTPGAGQEGQEPAGEDGAPPAGEDREDQDASGGSQEDASGDPSGDPSGDSSAGSGGSGSGGSTASTPGGDSGGSRAEPSASTPAKTPAKEKQSGTPSRQGEEGHTDPRSDGAPGFVAPKGPAG